MSFSVSHCFITSKQCPLSFQGRLERILTLLWRTQENSIITLTGRVRTHARMLILL